jgi:hypothetical protein
MRRDSPEMRGCIVLMLAFYLVFTVIYWVFKHL